MKAMGVITIISITLTTAIRIDASGRWLICRKGLCNLRGSAYDRGIVMTDNLTTAPLEPMPIGRKAEPVTGFMRIANELRRGEYFGGLFILGCASALASRVFHSAEELGWTTAFFNTFGISVLVWISSILGLTLVVRDRATGVHRFEIALGACFVFLIILPIGPLGWIAVAGLSLYILFSTEIGDSRRGSIILLATTVPVFWSPLLFQIFARYILMADAVLVSWLLGTHRSGNVVELSDHSGQLVIFAPCSSMANMSLVVLCWITLTQVASHKKSNYDFLWCFLACVAVVAVNVSRMALLGLSEWHYAAFHNEWSNAVVNIITLGLIVGICALGIRRELFRLF
jgi:hypothetical protein